MGQFNSVAVQFGNLTPEGLVGSGADLLIVESGLTTGFAALTPAEILALTAGGQQVIAYVNTSVTDARRSYWQADWVTAPDPAEGDVGEVSALAPDWLRSNLGGVDFYAAHPGADAYIVDYRSQDWRDLVIEQAISQVNAGYSGVFLDDVGRYLEAGYHDGGASFDTSLADAMMQLVIDVAAAVHAINPDAVIFVNAGVYIGGDSSLGTSGALFTQYLAAIDGVLIENQFNATQNTVLELARSVFVGKDIIALESLERSPNVEALLNYATTSGVLVQLAPDEGYDDTVSTPIIGTSVADVLTAHATLASYMGGGAGNDNMTGSSASDTIYGHAGGDRIYGGGGRDSILGGSSSDLIYGDASADNLSGGTANDRLYGGTYFDALDGGSGNDSLYGGSNKDTLAGGTGNDYLHGGSGLDVFVFSNSAGRDRVADFDQGSDRVDLRALDVTFTQVKAALHLVGGIVRLDLAQLGGSGSVDFYDEKKLSYIGASDFIL